MSKIDDLIRKAKSELAETKTVDQDVAVGGEVVTLRFTRLSPIEWRTLVGGFPAREGNLRDENFGYNFDVAPSGYPASSVHIVDGDAVEDVTPEQWAGIFSVLEAPDLYALAAALWGVHEYEPRKAVQDAKKAVRVSRKK